MIQFWIKERPRILVFLKDLAQLFVPYLGKRREHHQDESRRDGDIGRADLKSIDESPNAGMEISDPDADGHREEDPDGEKAIE